jgi:hypothetical protein
MTDTDALPRTHIDAKAIHAQLGENWARPKPFGADGWQFDAQDRRILVSLDTESDPDSWWIHASISYTDVWRMPSYSDIKQLHAAAFGEGFSYECFVPASEHINIRSNVRHLWGRYDGTNVLPDFGRLGTI